MLQHKKQRVLNYHGKIKNAKNNYIQEKERDKYKKIKTLSGIKTSYIDKSIKYFTKYDYRLKIVWKDNKTTFSNEVGCKSKYNIDKQKIQIILRKIILLFVQTKVLILMNIQCLMNIIHL